MPQVAQDQAQLIVLNIPLGLRHGRKWAYTSGMNAKKRAAYQRKTARVPFVATEAQRETYERAAIAAEASSLADWIRSTLDAEAERVLRAKRPPGGTQ